MPVFVLCVRSTRPRYLPWRINVEDFARTCHALSPILHLFLPIPRRIGRPRRTRPRVKRLRFNAARSRNAHYARPRRIRRRQFNVIWLLALSGALSAVTTAHDQTAEGSDDVETTTNRVSRVVSGLLENSMSTQPSEGRTYYTPMTKFRAVFCSSTHGSDGASSSQPTRVAPAQPNAADTRSTRVA